MVASYTPGCFLIHACSFQPLLPTVKPKRIPNGTIKNLFGTTFHPFILSLYSKYLRTQWVTCQTDRYWISKWADNNSFRLLKFLHDFLIPILNACASITYNNITILCLKSHLRTNLKIFYFSHLGSHILPVGGGTTQPFKYKVQQGRDGLLKKYILAKVSKLIPSPPAVQSF